MRPENDQLIYLKDYRKPEYSIDKVDLTFRLSPTTTRVISRLKITRDKSTKAGTPISLDGDELTLSKVLLNDKQLGESDYTATSSLLVVNHPPKAKTFDLEVHTILDPISNTKLMGLYQSNNIFCTQCEAEGFRRITYFLDRPDILSIYTTRIEASKEDCPILLGNGNLIKKGKLANGHHFATWHDPHPKPSYLFALVAGKLGSVKKNFQTMSGKKVKLGIYVEPGKESFTSYAMDALIRSMQWDEQRFNCEYDLDIFNIVAVSDFNMGAMENKGLNIFNDKFVLADPKTATDTDYANIEAIIAHEYFHNWTGNRITCRDWFQLCLKEGLTVYRDQEFSSDMRSRSVKRIADVTRLKNGQFVEDSGPLAHPVRPDRYQEINNFYTQTVYEKGAEIVRMLHTILGEKTFQKGLLHYLKKFDGTAATVEQFIGCFEKAGKRDLSQFFLWYQQAGTPVVSVNTNHDNTRKRFTLELEQVIPATPGQSRKKPMEIPLKISLLSRQSDEITTTLITGTDAQPGIYILSKRKQKITVQNIDRPPVVSMNRNFSAPIKLNHKATKTDLIELAKKDDDTFNRWSALQTYAASELIQATNRFARQKPPSWDQNFLTLIGDTLADGSIDNAYKAQLLTLPTDLEMAQTIGKNINPQAITQSCLDLKKSVGIYLSDHLLSAMEQISVQKNYAPDAKSAGDRALRNLLLDYGCAARRGWAIDRTAALFSQSDNMTEKFAALSRSVNYGSNKNSRPLLDDFYKTFKTEPLVLDKWFMVQALKSGESAHARVKKLMRHEEFSLVNPNRARSVLASFANNLTGFHASSGKGYKLMAGTIRKLDRINPQIAARMLTAFRSYKTMEPDRRSKAEMTLRNLSDSPKLSVDVSDILRRTLAK